MAYLWRAVDGEGEVLDVLVQSKRDKRAALKLMRKLLKKYSIVPNRLITDDLRSYRAAATAFGIESYHVRGRWRNNRAENLRQERAGVRGHRRVDRMDAIPEAVRDPVEPTAEREDALRLARGHLVYAPGDLCERDR